MILSGYDISLADGYQYVKMLPYFIEITNLLQWSDTGSHSDNSFTRRDKIIMISSAYGIHLTDIYQYDIILPSTKEITDSL